LQAPGAGEVTRRFFARHPTVLQVGSTVFVHGGLLPQHVDYGLERINKETQASRAILLLLLYYKDGAFVLFLGVHGGVLPHCIDYGLERINREMQARRVFLLEKGGGLRCIFQVCIVDCCRSM
jgi:hypothetical protein